MDSPQSRVSGVGMGSASASASASMESMGVHCKRGPGNVLLQERVEMTLSGLVFPRLLVATLSRLEIVYRLAFDAFIPVHIRVLECLTSLFPPTRLPTHCPRRACLLVLARCTDCPTEPLFAYLYHIQLMV